MNELKSEILQFANQNPRSWIATSDENQPHVRGMLLWFADETGFYYHTAMAKSLSGQIQKNPKVEVAFERNTDQPDFEMLRISGTAEIVKDDELEERLKQERSWLWGNIANSKVDTEVVIFRIVNATAYIWNMKWNVREQEAPRVQF